MDTPPAHANEVRAGCGYLCHGNIKLPAREKANYNEAFVVKQEVGPRDVTLAKMPWPDERRFPSVAGFRASVEAYAAAMEDLARRMLPIYAVALNLPPTYFAPMFEEPLFRMRLSQYAPSPADEYGINPHVDTSFFTILRPTGPGLVVQHVKRRSWVQCPHKEGLFVVNFGQLLSQLTNDRWPATRHYVLHHEDSAAGSSTCPLQPSTQRMSLPFFFNATPTHRMAVLPSCTCDEDPPRYPPTSYLEGQGVAQGE